MKALLVAFLALCLTTAAQDLNIPAASPLVRVIGRTAPTPEGDGGVAFDWEGVCLAVTVASPFTFVLVNITDMCQGTPVGGGSRWGVTMKSSSKLAVSPHHRIQTFYSGPRVHNYYLFINPSMNCDALWPGCTMGDVTFTLQRLTESRISGCTPTHGLAVRSFTTDGTFLPHKEKNVTRRRIGFIGDSMTGGDLNDGGIIAGGGPDPECSNSAFNNDVTKTVGAFLCSSERGFDADCIYTAWGGIVLGDSRQGWGMKQLFPFTFSSLGYGAEYGVTDFKSFPLDAVVINIGSNEIGVGMLDHFLDVMLWIATYSQFVHDIVHTYYENPSLVVFLAYGPMVSGYKPYLERIAANLTLYNTTNVHILDLTLPHLLVLVLVWMARGCNPPPASEIPV